MTDRECALQRKRVKRCMDRWFKPLGLGWWHKVDVIYAGQRREGTHGEDYLTPASAWIRPEYAIAEVTFYLPDVAKLNDDSLDHAVRHELSHLMIEEAVKATGEDRQKHVELVCTRLAEAFHWVRQAGIKEGKGKGRKRR